jgi:hypothetical protein
MKFRDYLIGGDNGARVLRDVELQRGIHLGMPAAADGVLDYGDLVAEFGCEPDGGLDLGVGAHADHDDFMHAEFLVLRVEVSIGESA